MTGRGRNDGFAWHYLRVLTIADFLPPVSLWFRHIRKLSKSTRILSNRFDILKTNALAGFVQRLGDAVLLSAAAGAVVVFVAAEEAALGFHSFAA